MLRVSEKGREKGREKRRVIEIGRRETLINSSNVMQHGIHSHSHAHTHHTLPLIHGLTFLCVLVASSSSRWLKTEYSNGHKLVSDCFVSNSVLCSHRSRVTLCIHSILSGSSSFRCAQCDKTTSWHKPIFVSMKCRAFDLNEMELIHKKFMAKTFQKLRATTTMLVVSLWLIELFGDTNYLIHSIDFEFLINLFI